MSSKKILQTGRNCWRIRRARKLAFLIDGAAYFKALYDSLPLARRDLLILSWDIYSRLRLLPAAGSEGELCTVINKLVRCQQDLRVHILSWDFSLLLALSREWLPVYRLDWNTHRRIRFCLDDQYPLGASHHQKVVVIDHALAFAGGLDLTRGRWDTPEHRADDPRRKIVDGGNLPLRPHHDVQMAVSGPAAAALGGLARERWRRATGRSLPPPDEDVESLWPEGLAADMEDVDVAIVRTEPAYQDYAEVREVEQLYLDGIAAARECIYIENQYFTAPAVAQALAERLAEPDGPEVVLNLPLETDGWLSQQSMDIMRVRLIRQLREADRHQRFMVYYPAIANAYGLPINLHAKVMIVDDRLVRVGSANLNNRSMGLDTECDLAVEASAQDVGAAAAIRRFRSRLLAEHLDCSVEQFEGQAERTGSLVKAIECLRGGGRSLRPLEPELSEPDERALRDIKLSDPERPVDAQTLLNHFVPEAHVQQAGRRVAAWATFLLVVLAAALAWRYTPLNEWLAPTALVELAEDWRGSPSGHLALLLAFIVGGLLVVPVTAMIVAVVLLLGPVLGFVYALLGSVCSALGGYGLGRLLGRNVVRRLGGKRLNTISRRLAKRGVLTMLVVRIVPVAPFTVVNLVAGASHIRLRDFVLGTLFGMAPGILAVTLLTDRVEATVRSPDWLSLVTLASVAVLILSAAYVLSKRLLRQAESQ